MAIDADKIVNLVYPADMEGPPEQVNGNALLNYVKDYQWLCHGEPAEGAAFLVKYGSYSMGGGFLSGYGSFR